MFAVVRTGGKQYRVAAGDKIAIEKIPGEAGDSITLGDVLLAGEGSQVRAADGLTVSAEIVAQAKGEKVIVFKKRRRHNYRRKQGHRQQYTILRITAIGDHRAEDAAPAAAAKPAKLAKSSAAPAAPAPAAGADADRLVPQDGPLKVDGAESPMVDAPVEAKGGVETGGADAAVAAEPTKVEPTESELVDAPKKKSTRAAKAAKDDENAPAADAPEGDANPA